ncbi:MAG TPA: porin [Sideroxyarcus sp.]|nr:porin [Sideroxyarcus sp.]
MQKKLIALAIASAISAPAFADNANVSLYGKAFLNFEHVTNDKQNSGSANRVQTNASRFGLKGSEDLGDGMKAFYQYEVQVDADGNSGNGMGNGTRNTGVGLEGGFGKVLYGNWDTPYKASRNAIELFDNTTSFSAINLMGRANGAAGKNYNTRKSNAVAYVSPDLGPVGMTLAYSPDEAPVAATGNKWVTSFAATLNMPEGIYAALAYEIRNDASVATTKDTATRLVGKYTLGDFWVGATIERLKVNTSLTANYTQSNNELAAQYKLGTSNIGLSYVKAGKTSVEKTGASQVSLRYGYTFSKRTEVFAAYTALKNDAVDAAVAGSGGTYGFSAGTAYGTAAGSKQTAIGLGMIHSF